MQTKIDPAAAYVQLGRLIAEMPDLDREEPLSPQTLLWLGRVCAFVERLGDIGDSSAIRFATAAVGPKSHGDANQAVASILYRALARAELDAPVALQGAFIPAGSVFQAFAAMSTVLQAASGSVMIVDPYMDAKAVTDFAPLAAERVTIKLLADQKYRKPSLKPAVDRWMSEHGELRPLEARLAAAGSLHDRLVFVDEESVYTLTQSLNAFAVRSPASIVRVDAETAERKIEAYAWIWAAADPI